MDLLASAPRRGTDMMPSDLFGYEVHERLGQGAGSRLYVVSDPATRQLYALKHVVRKTDRDVRFVEQLENEYEVGRQVNHPYVRRAIDMKVNRSLLLRVNEAVLVLELVDGRTLDVATPTDLPAIIECFIRVAKGLEAIHAAGFVHCDLKPINILVTGHRVKIIDLGQACRVGTVKQRIQGTPDYIAPEQVRCKAVSVRTDVFNFGATLYWVLCRRKLPTLFTLRKDENSFLVDDEFASPSAVNPAVPENLSNLVMECVRTNPSKRPADMGELIHRLQIMHHGLTRARKRAAVTAG